MAIEVNLDAVLDRRRRTCRSPISSRPRSAATEAVSDGDAELLRSASNVKTVGQGNNKHSRAAQLLTQLAEDGAK